MKSDVRTYSDQLIQNHPREMFDCWYCQFQKFHFVEDACWATVIILTHLRIISRRIQIKNRWSNCWHMQNDVTTTFSCKQISTNDCELIRPTYHKTAKDSPPPFPENYVPPILITKLTLTSQQQWNNQQSFLGRFLVSCIARRYGIMRRCVGQIFMDGQKSHGLFVATNT